MSGGAGYVLSREALRRFVVDAYPRHDICRQRMGGSEDKEMGLCLQNVGVAAGDSRDKLKRGRFFPSTPTGHIIPKDKNHWYWRYVFYATKDVSLIVKINFVNRIISYVIFLGTELLLRVCHILSLYTTKLYVCFRLFDLFVETLWNFTRY